MSTPVALLKRKCVPCGGGIRVLSKKEARDYLKELPSWELSGDGKSIFCEYLMKNFIEAIHFVNRIAKVAEKEGHHPDLHLVGYRRLKIELSTHAVGGLSKNDFILAAKIDRLPRASLRGA